MAIALFPSWMPEVISVRDVWIWKRAQKVPAQKSPCASSLQTYNHKFKIRLFTITLGRSFDFVRMKSFALTIFVGLLHFSMVTSEVAPFVMLNNGVTTTTKFCNPVEWSFVMSELFKNFSGKPVRRLGDTAAVASKVLDGDAIETSRDLQTTCDFKYSSFKPGCGGKASRRLLGTSTATCSANITKFNTVLNDLLSSTRLSTACKAYIGPVSSRVYSCREILDCEIKAIALWNAATDKVHTAVLPPTGTKICSSFDPSFQAVTGFDVGDVSFVLTRDGGGYTYTRREAEAPFFLFGNTGWNYIYSANTENKLILGSYTLTVVALMAPTKSVTIKFEVINCEV
jgi:hypothetical protein